MSDLGTLYISISHQPKYKLVGRKDVVSSCRQTSNVETMDSTSPLIVARGAVVFPMSLSSPLFPQKGASGHTSMVRVFGRTRASRAPYTLRITRFQSLDQLVPIHMQDYGLRVPFEDKGPAETILPPSRRRIGRNATR